jgi:hypothetical protein
MSARWGLCSFSRLRKHGIIFPSNRLRVGICPLWDLVPHSPRRCRSRNRLQMEASKEEKFGEKKGSIQT